jgi:hypothetical protein
MRHIIKMFEILARQGNQDASAEFAEYLATLSHQDLTYIADTLERLAPDVQQLADLKLDMEYRRKLLGDIDRRVH